MDMVSCGVLIILAGVATGYGLAMAVHRPDRDYLTGLCNRACFERRFRLLQWSRQLPAAVLICDIDRFKEVNDRWGHLAGDRLLIEVAVLLKDCVRRQDVLARLGGDEFVMLLPQVDEQGAAEVCNRICLAVDGHNAAKPEWQLRISVGWAVVRQGECLQAALAQADKRMYLCKGGRA